jgi:hypothetical protein
MIALVRIPLMLASVLIQAHGCKASVPCPTESRRLLQALVKGNPWASSVVLCIPPSSVGSLNFAEHPCTFRMLRHGIGSISRSCYVARSPSASCSRLGGPSVGTSFASDSLVMRHLWSAAGHSTQLELELQVQVGCSLAPHCKPLLAELEATTPGQVTGANWRPLAPAASERRSIQVTSGRVYNSARASVTVTVGRSDGPRRRAGVRGHCWPVA